MSTINIMMDNQSLYNYTKTNLNVVNPDYEHINQVAAQVASAVNFSTNSEFSNLKELTDKISNEKKRYVIPGIAKVSKDDNFGLNKLKDDTRKGNNRLLASSESATIVGNNSLLAQRPAFSNGCISKTEISAISLDNSETFIDSLKVLLENFERMYSLRSYVHWFVGEGMEELEFTEAWESIKDIF